jgi:hypothetical protein
VLTVREVADRYGVTTAFLVRALGTVGLPGAKPETVLSAATVHRFENEWGDRVRAARPGAVLASGPERTGPQPRSGQPNPHVVRVAYAHVTGRKAPVTGHLETVMAPESLRGPAHALDPVGTREGDPWSGDPSPNPDFPHSFYEHPGPYAACGSRLRVVMSEPFVADRPDACPKCVVLFGQGKAFRNPPRDWWERDPYFCEEYLRLPAEDGDRGVTVLECRERYSHRGLHRTSDGATWESGADDYVPAPDAL